MKKNIITLSLFTGLLILSSCGGGSADTTSTTSADQEKTATTSQIIDIKTIAGKTPAEVEAVLGKAESTEKVKGYPCKNSDCDKSFFKNGNYEIIFKNGIADRITISNTPNLVENNNAIQALGLPASEPAFKNPTVCRWSNVEGIHETSFFTDYILVQVTQPE